MARSKTSSSGLSVIVTPLSRFVRSWQSDGSGPSNVGVTTAQRNTPPSLILLSALRGEGVLRAQFFGNMSGQLGDKLPHQPSPAQSSGLIVGTALWKSAGISLIWCNALA